MVSALMSEMAAGYQILKPQCSASGALPELKGGNMSDDTQAQAKAIIDLLQTVHPDVADAVYSELKQMCEVPK